MGYDVGVGVGVYIEVKVKNDKVPVEYRWTCSADPKHKVPNKSKFCAQCGAPVNADTRLENRREALSPYDVLDGALEDAFYTPESLQCDKVSTWIPNGGGAFWKNVDESRFTLDLPAGIRENMLREFELAHGEDIKALKARYGEDRFEVKFGVVMYWH